MRIDYTIPDTSIGEGWKDVAAAAAALAIYTADRLRAAYPEAVVCVNVAHDDHGYPALLVITDLEADKGSMQIDAERITEQAWSQWCDSLEAAHF